MGEHREAQVYRGGIQRIGGLRQFHGEAIISVELSCGLNQAHGEIGEDAPVTLFVGIGEGGPGNPATDAQVVKLGLVGTQTGFNIAQALSISQLREGHTEKLVEMGKSFGGVVGRKTRYGAAERM